MRNAYAYDNIKSSSCNFHDSCSRMGSFEVRILQCREKIITMQKCVEETGYVEMENTYMARHYRNS